ncbi:MAG TPA: ATP-binding protein, partial [Acidimicrobiales bacterium]
AVVLAELLQNAVEHAFLGAKVGDDTDTDSDRDRKTDRTDRSVASVGHIDVNLDCRLNRLIVEVRDDGAGLPDRFDIDLTQSLGLSIVRDLVRSQLGGTITMSNQSQGRSGTVVVLDVPMEHPRPIR